MELKQGGLTFLLQESEGSDDEKAIHKGLKAFNTSHAGDSKARPLLISLRDENGVLVGGLAGRSSWNWMFVGMLWLEEAYRGKGQGALLLSLAEKEAVTRGCAHVYLDTFNFQAPAFYEKHGYLKFGTLTDFPPGFERHFFKKDLASPELGQCVIKSTFKI